MRDCGEGGSKLGFGACEMWHGVGEGGGAGGCGGGGGRVWRWFWWLCDGGDGELRKALL